MDVTITCLTCATPFIVAYPDRNKKYCSSKCEQCPNPKIKTLCVECRQEFEHYGSTTLCSDKCNESYLQRQKITENLHKIKKEILCEGCKEVFFSEDLKRKFCSLECSVTHKKPCIACGSEDQITVCKLKNKLAPFCNKCYNSFYSDPFFWQIFMIICSSKSIMVPKVWGLEVHIANHEDYCFKYLIFYEGQAFSNHYHKYKKEIWHCLVGELEVALTVNGETDFFHMNQGDKLEVDRKVVHQIRAKKNTILAEVSTQSFVEDSHKDHPSLL